MATKRKSPKRVAAGRKAARTRKRRRTGLSAGPRSTPARRRRRTRRTGMAEMFSPASARNAMNNTVGGMVGGLLAAAGDALAAQFPKPPHRGMMIGAKLVGGFVASAMGAPRMGAGIAGAAAYQIGQALGLAQNGANARNARYAKEIAKMPAFVDSSGQPLSESYLQENGYLQESYLQEDGNGGYQVAYAPAFQGPTY